MRISLTKTCLLMLASAVLPAAAVSAAPLDPKTVGADAQWVVHVDCDAMRDSAIGKTVRETCLKSEDAQKKINRFQKDSGVDLTKDMHGVTLYDNRYVENSGVAILQADNIDHQKLLDKLKAAHPDHETSKHGQHDLYTWEEGDHHVTGAFHGDHAVLFSRDAKQIEQALDVLDGKAPSLAADSKLAEAPAAGAFVVARGVGMDKQKTPFHADVVRKSKQLSLALGQNGNDVFLNGTLVAQDSETATKVRKALDGLRAMAELRFSDEKTADSNAEAVLKGVNISADGETVKLECKANGDNVAEILKKQHERMEKFGKRLRDKKAS